MHSSVPSLHSSHTSPYTPRFQDNTHSTSDNATTPTAITVAGCESQTQPTPDTSATSDQVNNARLLIFSLLLSHILYATWRGDNTFSTRASSANASCPRTGRPSRASCHVLKSASQHARP